MSVEVDTGKGEGEVWVIFVICCRRSSGGQSTGKFRNLLSSIQRVRVWVSFVNCGHRSGGGGVWISFFIYFCPCSGFGVRARE